MLCNMFKFTPVLSILVHIILVWLFLTFMKIQNSLDQLSILLMLTRTSSRANDDQPYNSSLVEDLQDDVGRTLHVKDGAVNNK